MEQNDWLRVKPYNNSMDVRQKQRLFKMVLLNPQLARIRFLPTSSQPLDVALISPPFVVMMKNMKYVKSPILIFSFVLLLNHVALALPDTYSRKFDEFQGGNWEVAMARLDNFDTALKQEPSSIGVLIVYGGRRGRRGEAQAWRRCLKDYMVNRRGISAERIVVVNGGYLDIPTVELWQSVSKEHIPEPTHIGSKAVRFRKGKIKNWRNLCNI